MVRCSCQNFRSSQAGNPTPVTLPSPPARIKRPVRPCIDSLVRDQERCLPPPGGCKSRSSPVEDCQASRPIVFLSNHRTSADRKPHARRTASPTAGPFTMRAAVLRIPRRCAISTASLISSASPKSSAVTTRWFRVQSRCSGVNSSSTESGCRLGPRCPKEAAASFQFSLPCELTW